MLKIEKIFILSKECSAKKLDIFLLKNPKKNPTKNLDSKPIYRIQMKKFGFCENCWIDAILTRWRRIPIELIHGTSSIAIWSSLVIDVNKNARKISTAQKILFIKTYILEEVKTQNSETLFISIQKKLTGTITQTFFFNRDFKAKRLRETGLV